VLCPTIALVYAATLGRCEPVCVIPGILPACGWSRARISDHVRCRGDHRPYLERMAPRQAGQGDAHTSAPRRGRTLRCCASWNARGSISRPVPRLTAPRRVWGKTRCGRHRAEVCACEGAGTGTWCHRPGDGCGAPGGLRLADGARALPGLRSTATEIEREDGVLRLDLDQTWPEGPSFDDLKHLRDVLHTAERAARQALADATAEELGHRPPS
jgi:hypothetical protein